jgi:hypothetical protein
MIRTSLAWLVVALAIQAVSPFASSLPAPLVIAGLRAFEIHALTLGWLSQFIFGVVYWMFPKASLESPRGSTAAAMLTFLALNLGLLLRAAGEVLLLPADQPDLVWLLPAASVLQWLAAVAFVANTWPRVKER